MKVLYIHMAGVFGGASRSLTEMITHFEENSIEPFIITPVGSFTEVLDKLHIPYIATRGIVQFDHSYLGYYRWMRWLVLLREIFLLPATYSALKKAHQQWPGIELIHANDMHCIIAVMMAKRFFKTPVVMHIRTLMTDKPRSWRTEWMQNKIMRYTDAIICIDETVKAFLPAGLRSSAQVIHNGFTLKSKMNFADHEIEKVMASIPKRALTVAMVGVFNPYKGVMEFLKAAKECKEQGVDVNFMLVGHTANKLKGGMKYLLEKFNIASDVEGNAKAYIKMHQLENHVHFLGFTTNLNLIYNEIDVICFPSYMNGVGRPVFEAAFFKKPSIVAIHDPKPDTVVHLETGICIPAKNSTALFEAIKYYLHNPEKRKEMGLNAFQLAQNNFNVKNNAQKVFSIYKSLLS